MESVDDAPTNLEPVGRGFESLRARHNPHVHSGDPCGWSAGAPEAARGLRFAWSPADARRLRLVTPKRILIYADGMEFHSGLRQRIHDTRQSNRLQTEGWQVLGFLDRTCIKTLADRVTQLQNALGLRKEG